MKALVSKAHLKILTLGYFSNCVMLWPNLTHKDGITGKSEMGKSDFCVTQPTLQMGNFSGPSFLQKGKDIKSPGIMRFP